MAFKPFTTFNNGNMCPLLGLGTWKSKPGEVKDAVKNAIDIGYRHFDCAHIYQNEKEVGAALSEKLKAGVLWNTFHKKDMVVPALKQTLADLGLDYLDLYLIHWPMGFKLWNTYHKKDMVVPALKQSLEKLGLNYLDLYLIHWPMGFKDDSGKVIYSDTNFLETWQGMEECVKLGLTQSIGLSNFNSKQIQEILDKATIKPVNNQVECHPYLNQSKLIKFCKEKGITVTAYSPLGSPSRPLPTAGGKRLLEEPKLIELAEKYGKSPAQILIKYQIQREVIVIPKSSNKERIKSNFDSLTFDISEDGMAILNNLEHSEGRMIPFFE
ncbi:hypothetical protein O3M35_006208 [Rhynocoris fuscipes]|uniref:NADP-dependent oxidoreductase domain-containing protein n=1 Tax=Rhynocoris fuscipes TaxID=488301 RepID=A0AAW1DCH5_9HEMI